MIAPENNDLSNESSENKKISIHLDGKDFEGFTLRMTGVVVVSVTVTWLTSWDGGLIFLLCTICWMVYFAYKIVQFKEEAYQQIIEDLEDKNTKLEKSNKLLQNVVQDSLGMRVSSKEEK